MKSSQDNGDAMENNRTLRLNLRGTMMPKRAQPPMNISEETKYNLGKVHYHLACLHGTDRFPETVSSNGESLEEIPSHCISSVIFHLCCAASLGDAPACLALARARIGLDSFVYVHNQHASQILLMILTLIIFSQLLAQQLAPPQIQRANRCSIIEGILQESHGIDEVDGCPKDCSGLFVVSYN